MASVSPAVEVDNLVVSYGSLNAVDGLSFSAGAGQVLALLGPNGAGKTTTVETLEGYRRPTSGTVRVLGLDPVADRAALTPHIGVMLQRGGVYPSMTPAEAVRLFAAYYDEPEDPVALLDRLGLAGVARTRWRRLSGGEQQRVSLALALVGRPRVAFLDEPTAGMDPAARRVVWEVVGELRQSGACVVLTTHNLEEAERLADLVVIVDHGRAVARGAPAELTTAGGPPEIRFRAPADIDRDDLGAHLATTVSEERPGEYVVAAAPLPATIAALTRWLAEHDVPLADLRAGRQTLEDVFLRLTAETSPPGAVPASPGGAPTPPSSPGRGPNPAGAGEGPR